MKMNSSLFEVKEKIEIKSESLVDSLYSIYEKNFKIINQMLFGSSVKQVKFNDSRNLKKHLILSSNHHAPDIYIEIKVLSPFTIDIRMYYRDNNIENIRYIYNVKFRLFLDAKILEVQEAGFLNSNFNKTKELEKEQLKNHGNPCSVQEKLTKSLLVNKWFNKLVFLEYTLNKTQ